MVTLLFQANIEDGLSEPVVTAVSQLFDKVDGWTIFRFGRQAARYGHHQMAARIFGKLMNWVAV